MILFTDSVNEETNGNYDNRLCKTYSYAREREDIMTEKIREYKMIGSLIIGVDAGYGNYKTARRIFPTAISVSEKAPVFAKDYIEMDGKYYIIGEGHKGFVADKVTDDDNYVLTMAAVVKELEARGYTDSRNAVRVHLAAGLPLKWVQAQREEFKTYMLKNRYVRIGYKQRMYELDITGCTVMPQCYSAVAENLKEFKGMNLVVDIGNGTMNLMYLNNGRAMESRSWTEKLGVFQCEQNIRNKVRDNTGYELIQEVIENFLRTGETDIAESFSGLMKEAAREYADTVFQKLRDYEYNEQLMKLHIMGGGAKVVETFGTFDKGRVHFNHDIRANAKGYEYYCYMILRHEQGKRAM